MYVSSRFRILAQRTYYSVQGIRINRCTYIAFKMLSFPNNKKFFAIFYDAIDLSITFIFRWMEINLFIIVEVGVVDILHDNILTRFVAICCRNRNSMVRLFYIRGYLVESTRNPFWRNYLCDAIRIKSFLQRVERRAVIWYSGDPGFVTILPFLVFHCPKMRINSRNRKKDDKRRKKRDSKV